MSPVAIPAWTADGVLPPINLSQPVSPDRSPYVVSLTDYVLRFGDTAQRRAVLDGYLRYRAALQAVGLVRGFQWLDGSFLEHVEVTERRAPNDIDVVTFFHLPPATSQSQLASKGGLLFDNAAAKATSSRCLSGASRDAAGAAHAAERLLVRSLVSSAEPAMEGLRAG